MLLCVGAVAVNGLIYVMGGDRCDSFEVYDPEYNIWTLSDSRLGSNEHQRTRAFVLDPTANINSRNICDFYTNSQWGSSTDGTDYCGFPCYTYAIRKPANKNWYRFNLCLNAISITVKNVSMVCVPTFKYFNIILSILWNYFKLIAYHYLWVLVIRLISIGTYVWGLIVKIIFCLLISFTFHWVYIHILVSIKSTWAIFFCRLVLFPTCVMDYIEKIINSNVIPNNLRYISFNLVLRNVVKIFYSLVINCLMPRRQINVL